MPGRSLTLMNKYAGSGWIPGHLKRDDKCIKAIVFHIAIECGTKGEMRGRQSSGRGISEEPLTGDLANGVCYYLHCDG